MRTDATKYGAIVATNTAVLTCAPRSISKSTAQADNPISIKIVRKEKPKIESMAEFQTIFCFAESVTSGVSTSGIKKIATTPIAIAVVAMVKRQGMSICVVTPISVGETEPINKPTPVVRNMFFKAVLECAPNAAPAVLKTRTAPAEVSATAGTEK